MFSYIDFRQLLQAIFHGYNVRFFPHRRALLGRKGSRSISLWLHRARRKWRQKPPQEVQPQDSGVDAARRQDGVRYRLPERLVPQVLGRLRPRDGRPPQPQRAAQSEDAGSAAAGGFQRELATMPGKK